MGATLTPTLDRAAGQHRLTLPASVFPANESFFHTFESTTCLFDCSLCNHVSPSGDSPRQSTTPLAPGAGARHDVPAAASGCSTRHTRIEPAHPLPINPSVFELGKGRPDGVAAASPNEQPLPGLPRRWALRILVHRHAMVTVRGPQAAAASQQGRNNLHRRPSAPGRTPRGPWAGSRAAGSIPMLASSVL